MVKRDELTEYIDKEIGKDLFDKALLKDDFANGVQILGGEKVTKVALGVSLNEQFLKKAIEWGSNFCVFHHGIFTPTYKLQYTVSEQKRLGIVFKNNLTVVGLHYVLDAHPKIGNNAQIIKLLGAKIGQTFAEEWGFTAVFDKPQDVHELAHRCKDIFNHEVFAVEGEKEKVRKIGVVSGAYKPTPEDFVEMEKKKVELLITGETAEYLPHQMMESGINYFVCGHYATEVFGIKELGKKISSHFGNKVDVKFIEIENPI